MMTELMASETVVLSTEWKVTRMADKKVQMMVALSVELKVMRMDDLKAQKQVHSRGLKVEQMVD